MITFEKFYKVDKVQKKSNSQKILTKRGGTHFFDFYKASSTRFGHFEKVKSQKILVKGGGAQTKCQKILVKWGGTQIGTF